MANLEVVLCNPVRALIGTYGGALMNIPVTQLGVIVILAIANAFIDKARRR